MAKGNSSAGGGSASCSTEQTGLIATPRPGGVRLCATKPIYSGINVGGGQAHLDSLLRAVEPLCEALADTAATSPGGYETLTAIEACLHCARKSLELATRGFESMEAAHV